MMKVYIAGPITGKFMGNVFMFFFAHIMLKIIGCDVYNPTFLEAGSALTQDEYMSIWTEIVVSMDVVVMLPGWRHSRGACAEYALASEHGIKVIG